MGPSLEKPCIRTATPNDIPRILQLIKDLADFEHCLDRVDATEETLRQTIVFAPDEQHPSPNPEGFSNTRPAGCFVLEAPTSDASPSQQGAAASHAARGSSIVGLAIYYHTYSTWLAVPGIHLEDLYVAPTHRKRGYATILFAHLAKLAMDISGGRARLQWDCLKWNENALRFYEGETIGGKRLDEWVAIRLEGKEALSRLAKRAEM